MPKTQPIVHIVALTGAAGSGKDSAACALASAGWRTVAYADAIRSEACKNWHIDERYFTTRHCKDEPFPTLSIDHSKNPDFIRWAMQTLRGSDESPSECISAPRSPRWVMQRWGDYKRRFNTYYWSDIVSRWIDYQIAYDNTNVVITDLRMPWEQTHLKAKLQTLERVGVNAKLTTIRIHRPGLQKTDDPHPTEQLIHSLKTDLTINNDSTLVALSEQILSAVGNQSNTNSYVHGVMA